MKIAQNSVVLFHYSLLDEQQNELANSREGQALPYLHGHGNIVPGLEEEMEGRVAGDSFAITVAPEKAYGERQPELVEVIERGSFDNGAELEVGMHFQVEDQDGNQRIALITALTENEVTVDTNHPLAGKTLTFDVEITDVREATEAEVAAGQIALA
ncbi:MAG: FKBP-type peptidyl-prolyl cis-trans isomerase [Pontibacterium sp.]